MRLSASRPLAVWLLTVPGVQRRLHVQRAVAIRLRARSFGQAAVQAHPPRPPRPPFADVLPDQDRADVGLGVVHDRGPVPIRVQPGDRNLHEIISPVPVLAQQVSHPAQRGHPRADELGKLRVPARPQHRLLALRPWPLMPS